MIVFFGFHKQLFQSQLIEAEKKSSCLENELQNEKSMTQQREVDSAQLKNDNFKLQQDVREKSTQVNELQRDLTQAEGKLKALQASF